MNTSVISAALSISEPLLSLLALVLVWRRKLVSEYKYLCFFLAAHICSTSLLVPLLLLGGRYIEPHAAYSAYFWLYWIDFAVEAALSFLVIYSIFDLAMAPLDGIRRLGVQVFRWAVCISLVTVAGSILLPHPSKTAFIQSLITEMERSVGVLTLCLLLFVCFAIRPLGLSFRSRIFGVLLGLGTLTTAKMLVFGWISHSQQLYSFAGNVDSLGTCVALLIWISYFVAPEAKRRIVVLPTTSPFLRWNQISQALGDAPGFVAVRGIPPELFAPAELEVMRRASLKMVDRPSARSVEHTALLKQSYTA